MQNKTILTILFLLVAMASGQNIRNSRRRQLKPLMLDKPMKDMGDDADLVNDSDAGELATCEERCAEKWDGKTAKIAACVDECNGIDETEPSDRRTRRRQLKMDKPSMEMVADADEVNEALEDAAADDAEIAADDGSAACYESCSKWTSPKKYNACTAECDGAEPSGRRTRRTRQLMMGPKNPMSDKADDELIDAADDAEKTCEAACAGLDDQAEKDCEAGCRRRRTRRTRQLKMEKPVMETMSDAAADEGDAAADEEADDLEACCDTYCVALNPDAKKKEQNDCKDDCIASPVAVCV